MLCTVRQLGQMVNIVSSNFELLKNVIQSEGVTTIYKEQLNILPRRYDEESDFC